jgi:hypothetical protein
MKAIIICLDFDGVINDYPGWTNEGFDVIHGQPVKGARQAVEQLRLWNCMVLVHSVRCAYPGGVGAIDAYLRKHHITVDGIAINKPMADMYVDDKGWWFRAWDHVLDKMPTVIPELAEAEQKRQERTE